MIRPAFDSQSPSVPGASPRLWLVAAVLVAAGVGVYWNSLPAPFVFDDGPAVLENPTIRDIANLRTVLAPPANGAGVTGRPIVNLSLAVDFALWRSEVRGYRATNIAIHVLAALTLFGILRRTLSCRVFETRIRELATPLAGATALAWTVHPLQTETVVCVIQRTESLVSLFYLLTLYGLIRAATGPRPIAWLAMSTAACFLGMASKEVMVTAPLIAFLYDRTFLGGTFRAAWRQRRGLYLGLASSWVLLGWLVVDSGGTRGETAGFGGEVTSLEYLFTQARAIALYLKLAFWPHPLVIDYGNHVVRSFGAVAAPFLFLSLLFGMTLVALRVRPVIGFCGAFFFAVLGPSSSVVPLVTQTIAEHRMYLPLAAVLTVAIVPLWRWPRHALVLLSAATLAAGALTVRRNRDYLDAVALWQDTIVKWPTSARAHGNLGATLFARGEYVEALRHSEAARDLDPNTAQPHYNLGLALEKLGRWNEAIDAYRKAIEITPRFPQAYGSLAIVYNKLERFEAALAAADTACAMDPAKPAYVCLRGIALAGLGRLREAVEAYRAVLLMAPDFGEAEANLGIALHRLGESEAGAEHLTRALNHPATAAQAHFNLGQIRAAQRRREEAAAHYQAAVKLDPFHALARINLGVAWAQDGQFSEALLMLEEAVHVAPEMAEAHANLGIVLAEIGRLENAERAYREALRLRPHYPRAHYNLGNALLRMRRPEEARAHFETAVKLAPDFVAAREMLAQLAEHR